MKATALLRKISAALIVPVMAGCSGVMADHKEKVTTAAIGGYDGKEENMEKATFGAGCFWGVEATFRQVKGVKSTVVGFAGGHTENPSYKDVCYKNTGHAESVEITYDPNEVSYDKLLSVFWENHDPTTLNRQGPDVGDQYRSVIFYHNLAQKQAAEASKAALEKSGKYTRPIVTQIVEAGPFYRAEDYHQQYLEKRGLSHCHL